MAVIIFKALEKCNSNCIYCEVVKKHQDTVMDHDLLETVFIRMDEYLQKYPDEKINLTWHGGEACLLGVDYFKTALRFQETHCRTTKSRIKHLIQSNITIITRELIDIFKEMGIDRIGSSFEPLPNIRGLGSRRDSLAYNRKFMQGITLVEENGLSWGVIYVVHKGSLERPLDIFYYLTNLNLRSQPNINKIYLYKGDPHHLTITPAEYADFLGALLPVYWNNRVRFPNLRPISLFIDVIEKKGSMMCDYSGKCSDNWMYIGPDGDASHCGRAGDFNFIHYGNIRDRTIDDILHDPFRNQFTERQKVLPLNECRDCRFWGICHGGCPLDAYAGHGSFLRPTMNCEWVKTFIGKYLEPVTGLSVDLPPAEDEPEAGLV